MRHGGVGVEARLASLGDRTSSTEGRGLITLSLPDCAAVSLHGLWLVRCCWAGRHCLGKTTHHFGHTYRVTPKHRLSLRRGRWSARFAVASKACLIGHRVRIMSGPAPSARDHRNALFCR